MGSSNAVWDARRTLHVHYVLFFIERSYLCKKAFVFFVQKYNLVEVLNEMYAPGDPLGLQRSILGPYEYIGRLGGLVGTNNALLKLLFYNNGQSLGGDR